MAADERARSGLQLWIHEVQATEGSRISRGAIRASWPRGRPARPAVPPARSRTLPAGKVVELLAPA